MPDNDKKQFRSGLQKDVKDIFDGVTIPGEVGTPDITAAKRDLGPENPMVAAATLQLLRQQRAAERANVRISRRVLAVGWMQLLDLHTVS